MDHRIYQGILQTKGFPGLPEGWASEWETLPSSADPSAQLFFGHHIAPEIQGALKDPEQDKPIRALFVLHGLGEHGGRYLHFPHYLQGAVNWVSCLDQRGHGRSEGLRGHISRFEIFVDDLVCALDRLQAQLRKKSSKVEIHLFAHSFGGLVALDALFRKPVLPLSSATISAPLLGVGVDVPLAKRTGAWVLNRVWGNLQLHSGLDPTSLSHDPAVIEAYRQDRLVHDKITPRMYSEMNRAMEAVRGKTTGIGVPLQMIVPMQDLIVDSSRTLKFYHGLDPADAGDRRLKTYPDFYHESFNETEKQTAFQDLHTWISLHSSYPSA